MIICRNVDSDARKVYVDDEGDHLLTVSLRVEGNLGKAD
jgi:hypothetical protein